MSEPLFGGNAALAFLLGWAIGKGFVLIVGAICKERGSK